MKNPFAKCRQRRREEKITIDWPHQYIVHHILYDTPNVTTSCGSYKEITEEDFKGLLDHVRETLGKLDVNADSSHIFDTLLKSKQTTLLCDLTETRLLHLRDSIAMRTDIEKEYHLYESRIKQLKALQQELESEKQALQPGHWQRRRKQDVQKEGYPAEQ